MPPIRPEISDMKLLSVIWLGVRGTARRLGRRLADVAVTHLQGPLGLLTCAFSVETMGLNPLLNLSRRRLAGRWGVASYGTEDERPIERSDLRILERNLGAVQLHIGKMQFLRIFDRNVLRFRHRRASALLGRLDDGMARLGLGVLSYNQIVKVVKPAATH